MELSCRDVIISEEYADLIIPAQRSGGYDQLCEHRIENYIISHMRLDGDDIFQWYNVIPKLYGLLDTSSMEASGIISVQNRPNLNLRGKGVLIGIIDTGIDYRNPLFRFLDGSSKVVAIWDQTIQSGSPPPGFLYGTQFTQDEIDKALMSENPLDAVPSMDENGHGTFLAGIAAGRETENGDFVGAAPDAELAIVKLKPAKRYLRDFFLIKENSEAFQENDIMEGIAYLDDLAKRVRMPLVICLGLGTNQGAHQGISPVSDIIDRIASVIGDIVVVPVGNETGRGHHHQGHYVKGREFEEVEIRVGEEESKRGFSLEFWARAPESYSMAIRSPLGEVVPRLTNQLGTNQSFDFIMEETNISIRYRPITQYTGALSIFVRFEKPTQGIWTLQIYNSIHINGLYNIWLPMEQFISSDTLFLESSPDTTLTIPAASGGSIVAAAYNHLNDSIYIHSGRGYPVSGIIKPDLAAPGVNVYGPSILGGFERRTGTSIAAAHLAGACALLMEWAIVEKNWPSLNTGGAIDFLIRGARRKPNLTYPNKEWGYGILDIEQVFEGLRNI